MAKLRFRIAIPARYASTRLPGKPLRTLAGRPLIEYVYRQALASNPEEVLIATDDPRIQSVAERFGASVCMTSAEHHSGTDRLAEVAEQRGWKDDAIVVNLQGDEPLVPPALIRQVASSLNTHPEAGMATLCARIHNSREIFDPQVVKVVRDAQGYALYFSRAPIPYDRDGFRTLDHTSALPSGSDYYRHIGLYAYRVAVLKRYPALPPCPLERSESLEQLRALWNGIRIYVGQASEAPPPGVDSEADLERVEAYLTQISQGG